jgi:hypothetical protein
VSRDDTYLLDILESANMALDYVSGKSWDEFYEDTHAASKSLAKPRVTSPRRRVKNIPKSPGVK